MIVKKDMLDNKSGRRTIVLVLIMLVVIILFILDTGVETAEESVNIEAGKCLTCHKQASPGLYQQWFESAHAVQRVTCVDCHHADKGDPDAFEHYGVLVATLVTPRDCGRCHQQIRTEFEKSHHAQAGLILDSQDAYLAQVTAGEPVAILGCESCHGCKVKIDSSSPNRLHLKSWPNAGIGRINPDGSPGACNSCHTRHSFSG